MADRASSTVVSYVLMIGVVVILTTILISAFAPLVTNQQQQASQSTLGVIGNDVAGDLETAGRLAMAAGDNGTVTLRTRLPSRVGGERYEIAIANTTPGLTYELTLRRPDAQASAIVRVRPPIPVAERTGSDALDGGNLRISYDTAANELVITNA